MVDTPAATPKKTAVPRKKSAVKKTATSAKAAVAPATVPAVAAASPIRTQLHATSDTIRAEASRKAGEIGDEMGRLYSQATEQAAKVAKTGKTRAAHGLESLAKVIEESARSVDDTLGNSYGDFARSAAATVAGLATSLDEKDLDELVAATRDFVKKSPAVAIGGAAVVGFMLARLLRSKSS